MPVLNHDRTDNNTRPMEPRCKATQSLRWRKGIEHLLLQLFNVLLEAEACLSYVFPAINWPYILITAAYITDSIKNPSLNSASDYVTRRRSYNSTTESKKVVSAFLVILQEKPFCDDISFVVIIVFRYAIFFVKLTVEESFTNLALFAINFINSRLPTVYFVTRLLNERRDVVTTLPKILL